MAAESGFVRVPPDSTGKKVATSARTLIEFDNQTITIVIGDTVTGANSNATGTAVGIETEGFAVNTGALYIDDNVGTWEDNENIEVSASPVAIVNLLNLPGQLQQDINTQHVVLSDPNNPSHLQKIDEFGATLNTFTEGSPQFEPFGSMMISSAHSIIDLNSVYGLQTNRWFDNTVGSATITHSVDDSAVLLTNTTGVTDIATRTSNDRATYRPGHANLLEMSIVIGDVGKTGVRRRWGLFDDNNGLYWELNDTTLNIVIRSSATGSVVNTVVAQVDFSDNKLDGSDSQSLAVDVSKTNIFWIDYQWLGSGSIRFGIYRPSGERIIAHRVQNSNIGVRAYMATGTLPVRLEQDNTGTPGSSSEMKMICASVKKMGVIERHVEYRSVDTGSRNSIADTDGEKPVISIRPRATFQNNTNYVSIELDEAIVQNIGSQTAIVRVRIGNTLTGASWANHDTTFSAVEIDTSATSFTGGMVCTSCIIGPTDGKAIIGGNQLPLDRLNRFAIILQGDGTTQQILTITIETIDTGTSNTFTILNWIESQF